MNLSAVDEVFWFATFATEVVLITLLFRRREFRTFPFFLSSILLAALFDPPSFWISLHGSPQDYQRAYIINSVLGYALQLGVLVEIAHRVLQPAQRTMPRFLRNILLSVLVVAFVGTVVWILSQNGRSEIFALTTEKLLQVSFVFSYLRLLVFALIAGFSQMLGITWRNHVIRLAAGLAFYSAVAVVAQITISHLSHSNHEAYLENYRLLDRLQIVSYLMALAFWVWSFVQKDAPRREFTPQMERFLVTISETARRSRIGLARSPGHK
jgi:hypothetical protein